MSDDDITKSCQAPIHIEINHDRKTVRVVYLDPPISIMAAILEIAQYAAWQELVSKHTIVFRSAKRSTHRLRIRWDIV